MTETSQPKITNNQGKSRNTAAMINAAAPNSKPLTTKA